MAGPWVLDGGAEIPDGYRPRRLVVLRNRGTDPGAVFWDRIGGEIHRGGLGARGGQGWGQIGVEWGKRGCLCNLLEKVAGVESSDPMGSMGSKPPKEGF